ncbi:MAG: efflux RND transporter periplasmic adaptor subunit [Desulfuromonadaceae bacterium]
MKRVPSPLLFIVLSLPLFFIALGSSMLPGRVSAWAQAAGTGYSCGMHPMVVSDRPGSCPLCGMDLTPLQSDSGGAGEREIKYWVAPMDPTYIRNEPGKSPMGMDLVPVYADEATGSVIAIDPVTAQNMGVRTAPAIRRDMARTIRTVGLVAYQEPRQVSVNTKIDGWVEKLYVNETGQQVDKGQKLFSIYSPDLVSTQEEFLLALQNYDTLVASPFPQIADSGRQLLEASRRRLQLWDISDAQIARLEQTRQVEKTLAFHAPESGVVSIKMVRQGQYVQKGMELMVISDISRVWVLADIYEYELPWARIGARADIILPFVGGKKVAGILSYLYPYVEPKTRTVKARFDLANADFELKPDMYVNVQLQTSPIKDALTVPVEAVLRSGEEETVFVIRGEGKFEPRRVKTGLQDEQGNLQVIQGLLDGERVVTSAQFLLDSESQLRAVRAKMLEVRSPVENQSDLPTGSGEGRGKDPAAEDLEDLFK